MSVASARNEDGHGGSASDGIVSATEPGNAIEVRMGGSSSDANAGFSRFNQRCDCCPYGYHIDLDFLHFLDSLNSAENLKTLKRFRRGANPSLSSPHPSSSDLSPNHEFSARETENMVFLSDGDGGVSPRQTLDEIDPSALRLTTVTSPTRIVCCAKQKQTTETGSESRHSTSTAAAAAAATESVFSSHANIFDGFISDSPSASSETTSVAVVGARPVSRLEVRLSPPASRMHGGESGSNLEASALNGVSSFEGVFDAEERGGGGGRVSPSVLQAIRGQLVVSLRRMKELEEQVKVIPILQSRISMLKEENSLLTTLTAVDRTYRDASVGDFSVISDRVLPSSKESAIIDPSSDRSNDGSSVESMSSHSVVDFSHAKDSIESVRSASMVSTHTMVIRPSSSNLKTVADAGVNTDGVSEPVKEFKSVGTLSKVATSDSCIGTCVESVDRGTGDDAVLTDQTAGAQVPTTVVSSETTSAIRSSEISSYIKTEVRNLETSAGDTVSNSQKTNESESRASNIIDLERLQSEGASREDEDTANRTIECSEERDAQNNRRLGNDKHTQTDDFLTSEYASEEILELGNHEKELRGGGGEGGEGGGGGGETQSDAKSSSQHSKKRITFGKVTIYEAEAPDNQVYVIDINSTGVDAGSTRSREPETLIVEERAVSETQETRVESESSSSSSSSSVECIVVEQMLESPQCGESVIIDDSNESSSAASSDSEDSSALSVLEVIPGGGDTTSVAKAVKSVDEYFVEGISVKEDGFSASNDVISSEEVSEEEEGKMKDEEKEEEEDDEEEEEEEAKALIIRRKQKTEEVSVEELLSKNQTVISLESEESTELTKASKDSVEAETSLASVESSENSKTSARDIASSSFPSSREMVEEAVIGVNGSAGDAVNGSLSDAVVVVVDAESSKAEDSCGLKFPVTDHREIYLLVKKRSKHAVTDSAESCLSLAIDSETDESKTLASEVVHRKTTSDSEKTLDVTRSSVVVRKKIIITEKRIERRRVDRSGVVVVDDNKTDSTQISQEQKTPALEFSSENLAEKDRSKRETGVMVGQVTGHTVEGVYSKQWDEDTDVALSIATNQTRGFLDQSDKQNDQITKDDSTESNVQRKGSEDSGESHSNAEKEDTQTQFDGNICDAMSICSQWLLQSPDGTDDEKISALDFVRRQWFLVCGRKSSSSMEVKTFLSLALSYGDALLRNIVNMADTDGNTALHYAVSYSSTDVIKHLLDTGFCDVSHQNKAGYTAIMLAALLLVDMDRHRPIIQYLFESGNVNVPSSLSGQTALMLAASHGRNDTVRLLLSCGADVNAQDEDGSTALMCASEHGHVDVIRTLLSDVNCDSALTDVDGSTALSIAMEESLQEIGVLLYAHMKTLHGSTPDENDDKEMEKLSPKQ